MAIVSRHLPPKAHPFLSQRVTTQWLLEMTMEGDTYSFVVRIWHEAVDDTGSITAWRGSIEQVGGDKRVYFVDLGDIAHYIEKQVGLRYANVPLNEDKAGRGLV